MFEAWMIGNNDGKGCVLGRFPTLEEAQQRCEVKERMLWLEMPTDVQAEITRDHAGRPLEWLARDSNTCKARTFPALSIHGLNGVVCFLIKRLAE